MKAYKAWDTKSLDPYTTVVFAENAREAKKLALGTDTCEDADYINVRVLRFPEMDSHYRGRAEIDWYDAEDRKALVSLGWMCLEISDECDTCPAREFCSQWEGEDE